MLRHADPARGTFAAHHQRREKQREADDGVAVEARQKYQRDDQQTQSRIPVRPHRAPNAQNLDRAREADQAGAESEGEYRQPLHPEPRMHRRRTVGPEHLQFQPESRSSHHQMNQNDDQDGEHESTVDGRAEEARQAVIHGEAASLRHRGIRIAQHELYQHIGEARAEKAHHQRRDDLVDAVARLEHRWNQRPERADHAARDHAEHERRATRQHRAERRCKRGGHDRRKQELAVAAQIPDTRAKGDDEAGGDQQQRRHAREGLLSAAPAQQAALQNITVIVERVLAKDQQNEAADGQCHDDRNHNAQRRGLKSGANVAFRPHAAAAPVIRRRTLFPAPSSFATMPAKRP